MRLSENGFSAKGFICFKREANLNNHLLFALCSLPPSLLCSPLCPLLCQSTPGGVGGGGRMQPLTCKTRLWGHSPGVVVWQGSVYTNAQLISWDWESCPRKSVHCTRPAVRKRDPAARVAGLWKRQRLWQRERGGVRPLDCEPTL